MAAKPQFAGEQSAEGDFERQEDAFRDWVSDDGSTPSISAHGTTNGVVWTLDRGSGELRAYSADNFSTEIWTSALAPANRDQLGVVTKFATPTVADGRVLVGTTTALVVYATNPTPFDATLVAQKGDPAAGVSGATFASFGNPAVNVNDGVAFAATLTSGLGGATTSTDIGIWADDNTGTRQLIARIGSGATGTSGTFHTLSDPVYNNNEAVAFRATLKVATGQATSTTATGIWCTSANAGSPALVARQGSQASGCPTGATFSAFTELALADQGGATNQGGVILLATLNTNSAAGVGKTNNLGIWAVDTTGTLQLIVRTGDTLNGKTVTGLAFLPALIYVNGQSRSFTQGTGDFVYLATFSDNSTGIFNVVFP